MVSSVKLTPLAGYQGEESHIWKLYHNISLVFGGMVSYANNTISWV